MHVLIIDDEAAVRQILAATVSRAGHSVDTADGVKAGAAKLVRGDVDVALCDIRMPDGDGVELVRQGSRIVACSSRRGGAPAAQRASCCQGTGRGLS